MKLFIILFLFLLTSGVSTGLIYLFHTTSFSSKGTVEQYSGSVITATETLEIQEKYPKAVSEMLITTHNHWIGFAFIFFLVGFVFYFSSIVSGTLKAVLLTEPFISSWFTFASIWALRFIHPGFVYLTIISAVITYVSYYLIVGLLVFELIVKKGSRF